MMWSLFLASLLLITCGTYGVDHDLDDACFRLDSSNGNLLVFDNARDISHSFRFRLSFNTRQADELLYYVEGTYEENTPYDYESLFLRNGILYFFAFNPAPYGAGDSFGHLVQTDFRVDTGQWVVVEFYRNVVRQVVINGQQENQIVTGMTVNGRDFVVRSTRTSLDLNPYLWVGGHPDMERLSTSLSTFDGEIRDFYDLESQEEFDSPNVNSDYEDAVCVDIPPPA